MNDLEKLERAKYYLIRLAEGTDPISGQEMPEDTCLNQVRLARCFYYVADILNKVIENGGTVGRKPSVKKEELLLHNDMLSRMQPAEQALQISDFTKRINQIIEEYGMRNLPTTAFTNWLVSKELLREELTRGNKRRKVPVPAAEGVGIFSETRSGMYGEYEAVMYSPQAQQFLIDHLERIVEMWKNK